MFFITHLHININFLVGQNSAVMINHCRTAIKNNNIEGLMKIIRTGEL